MRMDGQPLHHCFRMVHHSDRVCRTDFRGLKRRKWRVSTACRQTRVCRHPATGHRDAARPHTIHERRHHRVRVGADARRWVVCRARSECVKKTGGLGVEPLVIWHAVVVVEKLTTGLPGETTKNAGVAPVHPAQGLLDLLGDVHPQDFSGLLLSPDTP